jgi:LCP family protein required for cell wall assembly
MVDDLAPTPAAPRPHRPWLAALLSFAFPGLGQAYAGRPRDAVVFAVPVLLLVGVAAALISGAAGDRNDVLSADFLTAVVVVNVALLAWRIAAIVHAGLVPWSDTIGPRRQVAAVTVAMLLVVSVGMHAWIGSVVAQLEQTLSQVFAPEPDSVPDPAGPTPAAGEETPVPSSEPNRWADTDRINVMLLGTDAAPGREATLTDVILVLSIEPVDRSAILISVPRDTGWVPLPNERIHAGGLYPGKINELAAEAASDPELWCPRIGLDDPERCGRQTLQTTVGLYIGLEIHHYATVDMVGFAELIDAVGGLDLCLDGELVDPEFDGTLENRGAGEPLILPAGCHHYSGLDALAYARSRKGWIEMPDGTRVQQTDFDRNERQQRVLLALRTELAQADTLFELPGLIGAIGRTVVTDVPREQAGDLAALLPLITGPDIERMVLGYPEFVDLPVDPERNYLLVPKRGAIRDAMIDLVGRSELSGWYLGSFAPGPPPIGP